MDFDYNNSTFLHYAYGKYLANLWILAISLSGSIMQIYGMDCQFQLSSVYGNHAYVRDQTKKKPVHVKYLSVNSMPIYYKHPVVERAIISCSVVWLYEQRYFAKNISSQTCKNILFKKSFQEPLNPFQNLRGWGVYRGRSGGGISFDCRSDFVV